MDPPQSGYTVGWPDEGYSVMSKVEKSDEQWKQELSPEQFHITREKGTEPAFSGEYYTCAVPGTYRCICCDEPLFDSETKYDSGSGWPSFFQPKGAESVITHRDTSLSMDRTEVVCRSCGAHLGHVFTDGPPPTGLRYCINSLALKLEES